jgi:DNA-binding response OmpR family regulator
MTRLLLVEDDEAMVVALKDGFGYEGFEVQVAKDGEQGLKLAQSEAFDLVILDVMLPKMSGFDVCRKLREDGWSLPIIILSARGQEIDKVLGLKLGADDYLTKPFSFMELLARVEAVLRRRRGPAPAQGSPVCRFGDVVADFKRGEVHKAGQLIELSAREIKLLRYFVEHPGEVIDRDRLLDEVWDYDQAPLTRTVDMHLAKLRRKLEDDPTNPRYFITVHRLGYKFCGD